MEDIATRERSRAIVKEGLQKRAEARREAIRKENEAHARYEWTMIKAVNKHAAAAKFKEQPATIPSKKVDEAEKKAALSKFKRKRSLKRAIADGDDYLLQVQIFSLAFILADILGRIGIITMLAGVVARVLLVAWFAFIVYKLYRVSGVIADFTEE